MPAKIRIEFVTAGFRGVLHSPGVASLCASAAQERSRALEAKTGEPYEVQQGPGSYSRVTYFVKPEKAERRKLTHEEWVDRVWPRVGGAKWRPH